jgi:hypothetical protein
MPEIPCQYVHPTGWRIYLRVYWDDEKDKTHYHDARKILQDFNQADEPEEFVRSVTADDATKYDWPKKCDKCGIEVPTFGTTVYDNYREDHKRLVDYQFFPEQLYDGRERQAGDIWDAPWMGESATDCWAVRLPNGQDWFTYMIASNCTHPGMITRDAEGKVTASQQHKCWTVNGTPPNLDVSPSIWMNQGLPGDWHGHIRNGKLVW